MTLKSGYGTKELHLGQTSLELQGFLGTPARRTRASSLREYWLYPDQGLEAIVSRKSGKLLSLFFGGGGRLAGEEWFGRSEQEIRQQLGEPAREAGGFRLGKNDYFDRYLSYNTGIAFFLGQDHLVRKICITAAKRERKRKAVQHLIAANHRVAAFRRREDSPIG